MVVNLAEMLYDHFEILETMMTVLHKFPMAMTGVGLALMQLASLPVHAVDLQHLGVKIVDPYCASWVWSGSLEAPVATCTAPATQVVGAPTGCVGTVTPGASIPAAGGVVTLGVTGCTPGTAVLKNPWQTNLSGATIGGSTLTVPGYSGTSARAVVATNQACLVDDPTKCSPVTAQTTQLAPAGTGGGTGGTIACAGFDRTIVLDIPWGANTQVFTQGFGGSTAVVGRVKVPAGVTSTSTGSLSIAEYAGNAYRFATLTSDACNFSGAPGAPLYNVNGPGLTVSFGVVVGVAQPKYATVLQPGGTYYLNLRNRKADGTNSCPVGPCDAVIEFHKPAGT